MKKRIDILIIAAMLVMSACSPQGIAPASKSAPTVAEPAENLPAVSGNSPQTPLAPAFDEDNVRYMSSLSDKISLDTFDKLNSVAEYVVTGVCVSSGPVFQNDTLYTLSGVKIDRVYRGEELSPGETILVVEMGGRTTHGEYIKNCHIEKKAFETVEPVPDDYKIVVGMDGFFPLKEGERVLLFLADSTGFLKSVTERVFGIWGDYDGKLYLQPDGETYARPLPSKTDKLRFGEGTLTITAGELKEIAGGND